MRHLQLCDQMKIKRLIRKVLESVGVELHPKALNSTYSIVKRTIAGTDREIVRRYFDSEVVRRLHIGCGDNRLNGWLNSDWHPSSPEVLHLDACVTFPFSAEAFDYVFSEHMIEHISYAQGKDMLRECFRVLKPMGKLRVATPDLKFLIELYALTKSKRQEEYIRWATDIYITGCSGYEDTFVINNFVRNWGHQFIYDEKVLRDSLQQAGFSDITSRALCESDDANLCNLENTKRMRREYIELETFILEGTKR